MTAVLPFRSNNCVEYEHGTGMADFVHSILSLAELVLSHTGGFVILSQLMIIRQFHSTFQCDQWRNSEFASGHTLLPRLSDGKF